MALAAVLLQPVGWVASTQSIFGAQKEEIADQMVGVPFPSSRNWQTQLGSMWTFPENSDDTTGLGGGITYAWDPELCDKLMPLFREDIVGLSFITCEDAQAAVFRAFSAWATNSRFFKFTDVTEECRKMGELHANHTNGPYPHGGCPIAEIWITNINRDGTTGSQRRRLSSHEQLQVAPPPPPGGVELTVTDAEQGLDSGGFYVATALSHWRVSYDFRYTNGDSAFQWTNSGGTSWARSPRPILETYSGTFAFGIDGEQNGIKLCWYLDSAFCSEFHVLKTKMSSPGAARALMVFVFTAVTLCTLLFCVLEKYEFWGALFGFRLSTKQEKQLRENKEKIERELESEENDLGKNLAEGDFDELKEGLGKRMKNAFEEAAEWSPLAISIQVMLIIAPPIVLTQIILPCWDCYDFEAATLHELGHFLGLGHPDNIPDNMRTDLAWVNSQGVGQNSYQAELAAGGRVNSSNCHRLWDNVQDGVPASATEVQIGANGYAIRDAIMHAFTQHNPRPCLTADDVEGIATLYPDCSNQGVTEVVCHKVAHNIGRARIAVYVLVPLLITLLFMLACASYFHAYHEDESEKLEEDKQRLEDENAALKAGKGSNSVKQGRRGSGGSSLPGASRLQAPSRGQSSTRAPVNPVYGDVDA